ncbi:sodium-dependent bicarbonate transport family permease [Sulfurovum sp. TSL1]|uniref:sodium-dependent bicarbonate transport family permease n=1 Tax=Sulfurovum sp. TSL1 TaxID=2826994 RepID=UPI0027E4D9EE|nr:sodium-dependent bicarbonate transport family permease [Sulfurovum sp. TSL1]
MHYECRFNTSKYFKSTDTILFARHVSCFFKSKLSIPQPLPKLFSLYLLIAIGLHGGYELSHSGLNTYIFTALSLAILMAIIVPIYSYFILRMKLDNYNAIAIAATYGSISKVGILWSRCLERCLKECLHFSFLIWDWLQQKEFMS